MAVSQELNISGTVVSKSTGEVLPGANVVVVGTRIGAVTDGNGKFTLKLENMSEARLTVSYIGYRSADVTVKQSTETLEIGLKDDALKGEEIIVTGLATSVKRENLANTVASVSAKELVGAVPAQTIDAALAGKAAGISISQNTGAPGGGININLRGVATIEGSSRPLFVVDGVIVSNEALQSGIDIVTKAAAAGSATPQGQPTNRIADINPNDIENIEVLKGASAAAIYGGKASNGVIIITTKKGGQGRTQFNVNQQVGWSSLLHKIGTRRFGDSTAVRLQYGQSTANLFAQGQNKYIDYEDVMYGNTGLTRHTDISASGGTEKTQYYISGLAENDNGIIKGTDYNKYSARINLNQKFSDRINATFSANYVRSLSDRGITGNDNTNTTFGFSLAFIPSFIDIRPANGVYPSTSFNPSNPIQTRDLLKNREVVNRFMSSVGVTWNVIQSDKQNLDFIFQGGLDNFTQENNIFSPSALIYERSASLPGSAINVKSTSTLSNFYYNFVHRYQPGPDLNFKTAVGLQFENSKQDNVSVESHGIPGNNVGFAASQSSLENVGTNRTRGFFGQEEVGIQERIFLTAGVRADASSANGDPNKYTLYPKASTAVRLNKFNFWQNSSFLSSNISEFKVRAAFGETGNTPIPAAKFSSVIASNIGGLLGSLIGTRQGNPDIKPEKTIEFEAGFDATFWNERGTLEFTRYIQHISNLILERSLAPSTGYQTQFINAGKMSTKGWEISLGLTPVKGQDVNWLTRVNYYKTTSLITEMTVPAFNKGGFATFLGTYRIEPGVSPTTIIGAESVVNSGHLDKSTAIGNETPDFQISFNNTVTLYKNWEFRMLWDWKQGGDVINLGKLITDLGGTTKDSKANIDTRLAELGSKTSRYVEDGSYKKLRELSVSYTFPRSVVSKWFGDKISYMKVGFAARNLIMITNYTGYDPEVSQFGSVAIGRSVDTLPYPSSRSFYFNVSFGL